MHKIFVGPEYRMACVAIMGKYVPKSVKQNRGYSLDELETMRFKKTNERVEFAEKIF